jgi:hypothetical protein
MEGKIQAGRSPIQPLVNVLGASAPCRARASRFSRSIDQVRVSVNNKNRFLFTTFGVGAYRGGDDLRPRASRLRFQRIEKRTDTGGNGRHQLNGRII